MNNYIPEVFRTRNIYPVCFLSVKKYDSDLYDIFSHLFLGSIVCTCLGTEISNEFIEGSAGRFGRKRGIIDAADAHSRDRIT